LPILSETLPKGGDFLVKWVFPIIHLIVSIIILVSFLVHYQDYANVKIPRERDRVVLYE